VDLKLGTRDRR